MYLTFFQSEEYLELLGKLPDMEPFVFQVFRSDQEKGRVSGYIQHSGNVLVDMLTRRAIVNAGPWLADDISDEEIRELLIRCRDGLKGKAVYLEFRNFFDYSSRRKIFADCGYEYVPHLNFQIDTSSDDVVQSNLGKSRKRDIKVTLREGAEIVESPTLNDVRDFYCILENLYRTKVKTPLFSLTFFETLYTSGVGIYRLVRFRGRIIGGTLCVGREGGVLYEWFACGEDGKYKNVFPSTLATYAGISYAVANGYDVFDMMGAGKPEDSYGVREFKAKFGGKLVEHGRYLYVNRPALYKLGSVGVKLMKRLK